MGFWNSIWNGIKLAGKTALAVVEGGAKTALGAIEGIASGEALSGGNPIGGILGGIVGGVTEGIDGVSSTVNRVKHYMHDYENSEGKANARSVLNASADPLRPVSTMKNAVSSLSANAPASVVDSARSGAKFYDGLAKHGNVSAAAKYAGATPVSKHLGNGVSRAIIGEVGGRTGFHGDRHLLLQNAAVQGARMLPSTSAYHSRVDDTARFGGAESVAMKRMARQTVNPPSREIVVGGG